MSNSLLKKSLELVEQDLPGTKIIKHQNKTNNLLKNKELWDSKQLKPTVEEIRKKRKQNTTNKVEENVAKLLKLSSTKIDKDATEKMIQRAQTNKYVVPKEKPKEEEKSIFTEEDFKAFEKEYFS